MLRYGVEKGFSLWDLICFWGTLASTISAYMGVGAAAGPIVGNHSQYLGHMGRLGACPNPLHLSPPSMTNSPLDSFLYHWTRTFPQELSCTGRPTGTTPIYYGTLGSYMSHVTFF